MAMQWEAHQDKEPGQDANKKGPHQRLNPARKDWVMKQSRVRSRTEKLTPPQWVLCRSNNFRT
ncbi:unnamed protein product [Prunus armeniaca]